MNATTKKPVMMIVMDGWGVGEPGPGNAISLADTPVFDQLWANRPKTEVAAHGRSVGLPEGQMGNSEVGHLNLGAGRVVKQELVRIGDAVADGSFVRTPAFMDAIEKIKASGGRAHVMGLCSPGGVHSSLSHLYALVDLLAEAGLEVYLHALGDGRDTPPKSLRGYMEGIEKEIEGKAKVAAVVGRYWTMDRDTRWERVERGYRAHVQAEGQKHKSADEAIEAAYEAGETDEFIAPRLIVNAEGEPLAKISDGDGVFFFNFRADRAREITAALTEPDFDGFKREVIPKLASYVCMTEYQADFDLQVAFPPHSLKNILGQVLEDKGFSQFRCAETEKYAHVTFFFNGGLEEPFASEQRKLIPSPKEVPTYDLKPEMSARAVGNAVLDRLSTNDDDFILVNFANADMVGHTGVLDAAIKAAQAVDSELGRLCDAVIKKGGALLITADHGNSEQMWDDQTGQAHTAHTLNPVPVILVDEDNKEATLRSNGSLEDVAPTILSLMNIEAPKEMTGKSLLEN